MHTLLYDTFHSKTGNTLGALTVYFHADNQPIWCPYSFRNSQDARCPNSHKIHPAKQMHPSLGFGTSRLAASPSMSSMTDSARLESAYELAATAGWVNAGGYKRVALQMPDELLGDAVAVAAALERVCNSGPDCVEGVPTRVFVLADTTFGSCCVDEVAAAHHNADCIVHFGRACMSPVARLPARFVFNKVDIDVAACAAAIQAHAAALAAPDTASDDETRCQALIVLVDQEHTHQVEELCERIEAETSADANTCPIVVAESAPVEVLPRERAMVTTHRRCGGACACSSDRCGGSANEATCVTCGATNKTCSGSEAAAPVADDSWTKKETPCSPNVADTKTEVERVGGQYFTLPSGVTSGRASCAFVWVGSGDSPALTMALAVLHGRCLGIAQVTPIDSKLTTEAAGSEQTARVIKRRRFLIEKARNSNVVGIMAGTLGVAGYLTAIKNLRTLIAKSGRKSYTVVAGKPNPQKLANFPEIEWYVLGLSQIQALCLLPLFDYTSH
jgi:diphthamide biosynthesis protein 2